jgi:hypothetical protein
VCIGSTAPNCSGGSGRYEYGLNWSGYRIGLSNDTVINQEQIYGYDDFNRLSSTQVLPGGSTTGSYTNTATIFTVIAGRKAVEP